MPRNVGGRCSHAGCRVKRKMLSLSRKTVNLLHPSRPTAVVTKRAGERFSLISLADLKVDLTYQLARALKRESAGSDQLFGFHVVCGECDGYVVRNGALRNCRHQTESWSGISCNGGKLGRRAGDESGAQAAKDLGISGQLHCDHEALMQGWREWSVRWERLVRSR